MTKKEKVKKILVELEKKFGTPKCALDFKTPFELLVAVILSAQCTDKRVNIVTEEMFKYVNTPEQFANMELEEIENYIKSTGFFRNKAKNIKKCSEQLLEKYNGEIPKDMDKLTELAGVGRKKDPIKIELELMKIVPKKSWIVFSHYLILHGRATCIARRPRCSECEISKYCNYGIKKLSNDN